MLNRDSTWKNLNLFSLTDNIGDCNNSSNYDSNIQFKCEKVYIRYNLVSEEIEILIKSETLDQSEIITPEALLFHINKNDSKINKNFNNFLLNKKVYNSSNNNVNYSVDKLSSKVMFKKCLLKLCHEFRNPSLNLIELTNEKINKHIKNSNEKTKKNRETSVELFKNDSSSNVVNSNELNEVSKELSFRMNTYVSKMNFPKTIYNINNLLVKNNTFHTVSNSNINQDFIIYNNSDYKRGNDKNLSKNIFYHLVHEDVIESNRDSEIKSQKILK